MIEGYNGFNYLASRAEDLYHESNYCDLINRSVRVCWLNQIQRLEERIWVTMKVVAKVGTVSGKCIKQPAPNAKRNVKFRSNQAGTVLSTAKTVIPKKRLTSANAVCSDLSLISIHFKARQDSKLHFLEG